MCIRDSVEAALLRERGGGDVVALLWCADDGCEEDYQFQSRRRRHRWRNATLTLSYPGGYALTRGTSGVLKAKGNPARPEHRCEGFAEEEGEV